MPVGRKEAVRLPEDDLEWIALWEKRLDPARTSIEQFVRCFKVPTKRVERGGRAMTPFLPYDFQRDVIVDTQAAWDRGEGAKSLDGKARQEGLTTVRLLIAFERFLRGGGGTWNYFSYDDPHSIEAFSLLLKLKRQVPDWVYAFLVGESEPGKRDGGGIWTKKSHRCLELSFPGDRGATLLQCATAGGEFSGSGSAPRGVFLDEFTKYPDSVKLDHTGISEGWLDAPGNIFAYWGTGQGRDVYAEKFMANYGQVKPLDGFIARFRSWLGHPDRRTPFATESEREEFARTVGRVKEFGPLQEEALVNAGATLEELHWRRKKVAGPSFKYDLKLFARENPLIPQDMFVSESGSVFQVEILQTHDAAAAARERTARVGDFVEVGGEVEFVENRAGSVVLYEERRDDMPVCWGADSASGKSRVDGGRREADFADFKFKELYSGRTVCRFSGHMEGTPFAHQILHAARWFRRVERDGTEAFAKGFPEVNNESGMAMMKGMERYCEERGLDIDDFVLQQEHPMTSRGVVPERTYGWRTTRATAAGGASAGSKGILIDTARLFIADVGHFDRERGTPFDAHTLGQMYRYERDEKGATEAASGFDDAVMSEMLSLVARDYLLADERIRGRSRVSKKAEQLDPIDLFYAGREMQRKRDAAKKSSPFLGASF